MRLTLPSVLGIDVEEAENPIQQIVELKHEREGNLVPFTSGRTIGFLSGQARPMKFSSFPTPRMFATATSACSSALLIRLRQVMIFPRENGASTLCFPWTEPSPI